MRVDKAWWGIVLLTVAACSSGNDGGSGPSAEVALKTYNSNSTAFVAHMEVTEVDALLAITSLNQGDYAMYDHYTELFLADIAKADTLGTALYDSALALQPYATSSSSTSGMGTARLQQPIGVLETLALIAAAGAFVKFVRDVGYAASDTIKDKQAVVNSFVKKREAYYVATGEEPQVAHQYALHDAESVELHQGVDGVYNYGKTVATKAGQQVVEGVVGATVPGASTLLDLKNAHDTATLIGESSCGGPSGQRDLRALDCRLYVASTTTGQFTDVPIGTWNFAATSEGYAPKGVSEATLVEGEPYTLDDWETVEEAAGASGTGGSGGTAGASGGGSGGGPPGSCESYIAASEAKDGAWAEPCKTCMLDNCGSACSACMAVSCIDTYAPCYDACDASYQTCPYDCGTDATCSAACWDTYLTCVDQCDGGLMGAVRDCNTDLCWEFCALGAG